jgi:hypothetical protein
MFIDYFVFVLMTTTMTTIICDDKIDGMISWRV